MIVILDDGGSFSIIHREHHHEVTIDVDPFQVLEWSSKVLEPMRIDHDLVDLLEDDLKLSGILLR